MEFIRKISFLLQVQYKQEVHHQMEEKALMQAMEGIGYEHIKTEEFSLPNGKKLVMLDFER